MAIPDRMQWFREARFGMFVHWGVYSIPGRGEWLMYVERIPHSEYAPLAAQFRPDRYNPDDWVALAKEAGMQYMVLTTRHHDGYSLFDSKVSDFTAPKTGPGRDLIAEYVEACRRGGMRVGFYYSIFDWRFPAFFAGPEKDPDGWAKLVEYVHTQVRELCTQYGKIDILWYDGAWTHSAEDWRSVDLNAMVRQLQPDIIINDRSRTPEDWDTPEQVISPSQRPWESCMTVNEYWWGYCPYDQNLKSPMQLVHNLVRCVTCGGNYLLNVGPKPDGTIPEPVAERLREVGRWMARNGESVHGAGPCAFGAGSVGWTTANGNHAYVHASFWPGEQIRVAGVGNCVRRAYFLDGGRDVVVEQKGDIVTLKGLPKEPPDRLDTVIVLELDGTPRGTTIVSL